MRNAWDDLRNSRRKVERLFENFRRGIEFEEIGREKFQLDSGVLVEECGFFRRGSIGASPDGLLHGYTDHLLEIKTRASGQPAPLSSVSKNHVIQVQLQLYVTGKTCAILSSFHPETMTSNYFLMDFDPGLPGMLLPVLKAIKSCSPILETERWEPSNPQFDKLWEDNQGKVPDFESLAALRRWCSLQAKKAKRIVDLRSYFIAKN